MVLAFPHHHSKMQALFVSYLAQFDDFGCLALFECAKWMRAFSSFSA